MKHYKCKTRAGVQRKIDIAHQTIESAKTIKNATLRKIALAKRRRALRELTEQLNEFGLLRRRIEL